MRQDELMELVFIIRMMGKRNMRIKVEQDGLNAVLTNKMGNIEVMVIEMWKVVMLLREGFICPTLKFGGHSFYRLALQRKRAS